MNVPQIPSGGPMQGGLKCIITDDEPFARKGLQGYIEKIDFLELAGVCENAIELNSMLRKGPVHLLFLDIEMPYLSGIEFLRNLSDPPKVIFTTAYEKYAIQGFELEVLDYLLKPISFERFLKAANKAADYFNAQQQPDRPEDYIFVKAEGKLEKINFDDIIYMEAMENYVTIHTADRKIIAHLPLRILQEKLPVHRFIQPHKSFLVAIDKIITIEGNMLHAGKAQIPISKYYKEVVMDRIVNNKLLKR